MAKEKDLMKDSGAESMAAASGKKTSKPKKTAVKKSSKRSVSKLANKPGKRSRAATPARSGIESADPVDVAIQDIELRAYYIAERRRNMGWPGDERSDWIEAERQLREESLRKRKRSR